MQKLGANHLLHRPSLLWARLIRLEVWGLEAHHLLQSLLGLELAFGPPQNLLLLLLVNLLEQPLALRDVDPLRPRTHSAIVRRAQTRESKESVRGDYTRRSDP